MEKTIWVLLQKMVIVRNQTLPWKRNIVKFQFKEKEEERIIISIE
jgi:hypothetical protein